MAVERINHINITKRGLFTALFGLVSEGEYFIDQDLKKYSLWSQLYCYLKNQAYDVVVFYDTSNNFHSYCQNDLVEFLNLEPDNTRDGKIEKKYQAKWKSPLGYNRHRQQTELQQAKSASNLESDAIQCIDDFGHANTFYRQTMSTGLYPYFQKHLANSNKKTAIIIKFPDNSAFSETDRYLTLFKTLQSNYLLDNSLNKVIVVYGCSNSDALIETLNRDSNYLFVNDFFKSLFLSTSLSQNSLNYRVKDENAYQVSFPDSKELRSWFNRERILGQHQVFDGVPIDKIVTRLSQKRIPLATYNTVHLTEFVKNLSNHTAWGNLNQLVGLKLVKEKISDMVKDIQFLRENGMPMTYRPHLCFLGNPGTGKTTVASMLAEIFQEEGIVPIGHYVSTKASELIGSHVGEAATLVREKCENARGGVLFIDEAYGFIEEGTKQFGDNAVTELIAWIEDKKWQQETIVVLAGYPDEISELFEKSNKGLKGRFSEDHFLNFENYSPEELLDIFILNLGRNGLSITDDATDLMRKVFKRLYDTNKDNKHWDNARRVENIFKLVFSSLRKRGSIEIRVNDIPKELSEQVVGKSVADIKESPEYVELVSMIGLSSVKQTIESLIESINFEQYKIENGLSVEKSIHPLHLVFTGPPGTGKTTVARLFGKLLKNLAVLPKGHMVEVGRSELVGSYVGHTEKKTEEVLKKSMGGVLFIDEAYTLASRSENDFGPVAIETLLPVMENKRDQFVVIAAGYERNMNEFLASNPGLKDRFNQIIPFPNYSDPELIEITMVIGRTKKYTLATNLSCVLEQYYSFLKQRDQQQFGNARVVRKLIEETIKQQQVRLNQERKSRTLEKHELTLLLKNDFQTAIGVLNSDIYDLIDFNCICSDHLYETFELSEPDAINPESIPEGHLPHSGEDKPKTNTIEPIPHGESDDNKLGTISNKSVSDDTNHGGGDINGDNIGKKDKEPVDMSWITGVDEVQIEKINDALSEVLYDCCIVDTNLWMDTQKTALYHRRLEILKDLYHMRSKTFVVHGSSYEELMKFANIYSDKKKKRRVPSISKPEEAAFHGFQLLKKFHLEKAVVIPELKSEHDSQAYADKDIYEYACKEFDSGRSVLFLTNDNDCNIRVSSALRKLGKEKSVNQNFDVLPLDKIADSINLIYRHLIHPRKN